MNILNFQKFSFNKPYIIISILGICYKLNIKYAIVSSVQLIRRTNEIDIILPKSLRNMDNSSIINLAIKKLYEDIAKHEIEASLELVRHILKFAPDDYKFENLKNTYYKCTSNKTLIINPYIVQFNREIINTTLIGAFCKILYKTNSVSYQSALSVALEKYEDFKRKPISISKAC